MNEQYLLNRIKSGKCSIVTKPRLKNLIRHCKKFSKRKDVSFVECGIAKGGCVALMRKLAHSKAKVFGFDAFREMPQLTDEDEGETKAQRWVGVQLAKRSDVDETMKHMKVKYRKNLHIVSGFFQDTFPIWKDKIQNIAILRLDADWYEATKYCLEELYDKVIPGGVILIDDYDAYIGCRKAVNEFRAKHNIVSKLFKTKEFIPGRPNGVERWWRK